MKPRYIHTDTDLSNFVGTVGDYDLWIHQRIMENGTALIMRSSSKPTDIKAHTVTWQDYCECLIKAGNILGEDNLEGVGLVSFHLAWPAACLHYAELPDRETK